MIVGVTGEEDCGRAVRETAGRFGGRGGGAAGAAGIRVDGIRLGAPRTAMAARNLPPQARGAVPGRCGGASEGIGEDAAYAALFLAGYRARWISGHMRTGGGGPYYLVT